VNAMSLKKLFLGLLLAVPVLTITAGCAAPEQNAIELIPQGVNLIANIQISKIVNDQDIREVYTQADKGPGEPQTVEDALNELVEETGIDLGDFSQAVVFTDIGQTEQADYVGFVAEGTFNEKQFIQNIEEKTGEKFTTNDYKGYKLYTDEDGEFAIAFLSKNILLGGSPKAVKDSIDVRKGDRNNVSGQILDTYNRLGDTLIKVAFELPDEARKELKEEPTMGDIPISFSSFADVDIIGFALNKKAETISIRINPHFLSMDSAQDAKDTLNGAIMLFKGMLQEPEIKELLEKVEVIVDDSRMTISFDITIPEIERIMETYQ
jgi:hypothetical protein